MQILIVGLGGFVGAILRYKLCALVRNPAADWKFPTGTFMVNIAGCLLAGMVTALALKHSWMSHNLKLLLITGLLGGFTTFSAFGLETVQLLQKNELFWAGLYVISTILTGMLALGLGLAVLR